MPIPDTQVQLPEIHDSENQSLPETHTEQSNANIPPVIPHTPVKRSTRMNAGKLPTRFDDFVMDN